MAKPSMTPATPGNLFPSQALAKNANLGVYLDYSTKLEGQVTARVTTSGAATLSSYTKHEGYAVYGSTTLSGAVTAGVTSIQVATTVGMASGQKIFLENELVTIGNLGGNTLILTAATLNAHNTGVAVYLIESIATYPGTNSLGGTGSTTYAKTTFLSTGQWVFLLTNTDSSNGVLVELSAATIDSFA